MLRRLLTARRAARLRHILNSVETRPNMSVLDIGCGIDGRSFSDHAPADWRITGIDLHDEVKHVHPRFAYRRMSVTDMRAFEDQSFDLAVSFGMLEHITGPDYISACREIQRVSKQYAILVPFKWAWLEPHYKFPFFGALPKRLQRAAIRAFNLSGHRHHLWYFERNFAWRSNAEYRRDFPGARIKLMPTLETIAIIKSRS